ncbi:hypothetical protein ABBQ38_009692 [Trebouxia sp. C0009 RCD-2024]
MGDIAGQAVTFTLYQLKPSTDQLGVRHQLAKGREINRSKRHCEALIQSCLDSPAPHSTQLHQAKDNQKRNISAVIASQNQVSMTAASLEYTGTSLAYQTRLSENNSVQPRTFVDHTGLIHQVRLSNRDCS